MGKVSKAIYFYQILELNSQNYGSFIITKNRDEYICGKNTEHKGRPTPSGHILHMKAGWVGDEGTKR